MVAAQNKHCTLEGTKLKKLEFFESLNKVILIKSVKEAIIQLFNRATHILEWEMECAVPLFTMLLHQSQFNTFKKRNDVDDKVMDSPQ